MQHNTDCNHCDISTNGWVHFNLLLYAQKQQSMITELWCSTWEALQQGLPPSWRRTRHKAHQGRCRSSARLSLQHQVPVNSQASKCQHSSFPQYRMPYTTHSTSGDELQLCTPLSAAPSACQQPSIQMSAQQLSTVSHAIHNTQHIRG